MQSKSAPSTSRMDEATISLITKTFGYLHHCNTFQSFEDLLKGSSLSPAYVSRIKSVAIDCHILIKQGNKVKYRNGLTKPSKKMIINLINNEVRPTRLSQFSDKSIIRELAFRGYKISK